MSVPVSEPSTPVPGAAGEPPIGDESARPERFTGPRSRRATYALLVFIGIELGLIGSFLSLQVLHLAGVAVPVGPVVAVVANLATGVWAVRITRNRAAAAAPGLGWLATVLLLSTSRGEGDLVITNSGKGVAFLLLGALAWALAGAGGRIALRAQPD